MNRHLFKKLLYVEKNSPLILRDALFTCTNRITVIKKAMRLILKKPCQNCIKLEFERWRCTEVIESTLEADSKLDSLNQEIDG